MSKKDSSDSDDEDDDSSSDSDYALQIILQIISSWHATIERLHLLCLVEKHMPEPPPDDRFLDATKGGRASFCSLVWDQKAEHLVTASSSDVSISIHNPLLPSAALKILCHHGDGVTALALSPNSTCLASGSVDHSVKLYKFPAMKFSNCMVCIFDALMMVRERWKKEKNKGQLVCMDLLFGGPNVVVLEIERKKK
ncbi:WD domain, G-beta repeat protein [Medicago truncatula]|uniref:WD domain, G-beta repeat protein n=1 Tax=Medicago truncatula TaxID=3880 RepID=A0A072TZJ2_MEDTR|nr:WD domain, G-beta repeat protein [Medicago truncatula]